MGRNAYAARLALGRSPFDAPLQDDNGNFTFGPNAQHDTTRNYVQHFDARGHPHNLASDSSRRRLIRAQNDALSTVGVVVRKSKSNRSPWQTMSDKQRHLLLLDENIAGANCGIVENVLQKLSTRWIVCVRRRLLTYKSYLGLSIPETILADWRSQGLRAFFFAGLPCSAIASVSQSLRDSVLDDDRVASLHTSSKVHSSGLVRLIQTHSLRIAWFAVEYPLYAFSVLQSLNLVPVNAKPPFTALIPFTASSPIQLPESWPDATLLSLASIAWTVVSSPFALAYIKDQVGKFIFTRIYLIARHFLVKPDRPDRLSLQSAKDNVNIIPESTVPDNVVDRKASHRPHGLDSVMDTVRTLFPALFWLWDKVLQTQRSPLTVELSPDIEEELMYQSIMHYRNLLREDREVDAELRRPHSTLRVMAIRSAFSNYNLNPDHAMVDIFELAEDMMFRAPSDVSTATPEPLEPPPVNDNGATVRTQNIPVNSVEVETSSGRTEANPEGSQDNERTREVNSPVRNIDGAERTALDSDREDHSLGDEPSPRPAVALETVLWPDPSHAEPGPPWEDSVTHPVPPPPASEAANSPAPGSPAPGISRAASLPDANPRPVRRPTDIDEGSRPTREDLFYQQHPSRKPRPDGGPVYRVTLLSNHPAETLALIGASITESALLLPFDMLFLRWLAHNYVTYRWIDPHGSIVTPPLADEWPLGSWFGVPSLDGSGCLRLFGNWSISLGIQAMVNLALWSASTQFTLWLGSRYGWGKI